MMNDADDVQDPPFDMTIAADLVNASRRFRVLLEASCCICLTSVLDSTAPFQDILISNTLLNSRDEHIYNSTRSASLGCSGPRFPPLNPPAADKPTRSVPYLLHTIPYLADAVARVKNTYVLFRFSQSPGLSGRTKSSLGGSCRALTPIGAHR